VADGVSHGRADANGREVHDEIGEAKHDLSERLGEAENRFLNLFGHVSESDGKKNGEDCHLEDLVFGDGLGDIFGEDVKEEVGPAESGDVRPDLGGCRSGENEAFAGSGQIDGGDAEKKRNGGDGFEIDQALPADAADFAEVAVSGDAGDESAEDERSDNDFDEAEENVAEETKLGGEGRCVEAEFETGEQCKENPEGEGASPQACGGEDEKAETAESDRGLVAGQNDEKQTACEV